MASAGARLMDSLRIAFAARGTMFEVCRTGFFLKLAHPNMDSRSDARRDSPHAEARRLNDSLAPVAPKRLRHDRSLFWQAPSLRDRIAASRHEHGLVRAGAHHVDAHHRQRQQLVEVEVMPALDGKLRPRQRDYTVLIASASSPSMRSAYTADRAPHERSRCLAHCVDTARRRSCPPGSRRSRVSARARPRERGSRRSGLRGCP